jgi:hypothetical protein
MSEQPRRDGLLYLRGTLGAQRISRAAKGGRVVPVFMDTHRFKDEMPSDEEIRKAHAADLSVQERHGVNYMKYWVSKEAKVVHCLVEAPDAETAKRVHAEATGLMPDEIYKVDERS